MNAPSAPSILITGCSSGIGLDAARTLHTRGWRVLATCRKQADCDTLISEGLESLKLDYADENSVRAAAADALDRVDGRLDALFNNGAFGIPGLVEDLPRDALRSIFETNLFGQFQLINELLPSMRRHDAGRIINCSSVLGFTALPFRGAYNATKFAMEGLTDTLRLELDDTGIQVVLIEPGPIATRIRENSIPHFERWIDTEKSSGREKYRQTLIPRLYRKDGKKDRFELEPSAVTAKLIHALESPHPRARYFITTPTWISAALKRFLPTKTFDRFCLSY